MWLKEALVHLEQHRYLLKDALATDLSKINTRETSYIGTSIKTSDLIKEAKDYVPRLETTIGFLKKAVAVHIFDYDDLIEAIEKQEQHLKHILVDKRLQVRLPFPIVWVDFYLSPSYFTINNEECTTNTMKVGILLIEDTNNSNMIRAEVISQYSAAERRAGHPDWYLCDTKHVITNGVFNDINSMGIEILSQLTGQLKMEAKSGDANLQARVLSGIDSHKAMVTTGYWLMVMLIFKNLTLMDQKKVVQHKTRLKKNKLKSKKQLVNYKVLAIDLNKTQQKRLGVKSNLLPVGTKGTSLSRGSYRTYKKNADGTGGLFGKLEGTWWWHPVMDGKIDKSYKV